MNFIFKSAMVISLALSITTSANAQFLKKLGKTLDKGIETVDKILPDESTENASADSTANDSVPSPKEFLEQSPNYSLKKVTLTDAEGNVLKNEDGTIQSKILVIDKDGKVCDRDIAKKHMNAALKSGTIILAKVAATTTGGAIAGKKIGGKKGALVGALAGTGAGLLISAGDIKKVNQQITLMKECKKLLAAYEKNFTVEGEPIDATADLKDIEGFDFTALGEVQKSTEDIKNEFAASKNTSGSLEDIDLDNI